MKFELPAKGIIKKINKNRPSVIRLTKYDILVSFDCFTKIDGCKFEHLEPGDKIIIHKMHQINRKSSKYFMCQHIGLVNLQKKWNKILKKDKKYSIDHNLASSRYFTRPEIIEPSSYHVQNVPISSNMSTRDKKVISLYNEGKSSREIGKKVKLSHYHVQRIINSYKNKGKS